MITKEFSWKMCVLLYLAIYHILKHMFNDMVVIVLWSGLLRSFRIWTTCRNWLNHKFYSTNRVGECHQFYDLKLALFSDFKKCFIEIDQYKLINQIIN